VDTSCHSPIFWLSFFRWAKARQIDRAPRTMEELMRGFLIVWRTRY
jgi:transposase